MTQNSRHAHHIVIFRVTSASCDHQSFHGRRWFWSNSSFNHNFPGKYHNNTHNPNITLNDPEACYLEQVRCTINYVNWVMTVMADQAIIQAAISSVETFEGNKNKFEAWIKCSTDFWSRHLMNSILKNDRFTSNLSPQIESWVTKFNMKGT